MEKLRDKSPITHHLVNRDESPQQRATITISSKCRSSAHRNSNNNNNNNNNNNSSSSSNRNQFPSVILFVSVIIIVNLCPFQHPNFESSSGVGGEIDSTTRLLSDNLKQETLTEDRNGHKNYLSHIETCGNFMRLMFTNPVRLNKRMTRFIQAEARMRRRKRQPYGYRPSPHAYMYHHHHQQAPMYPRGASAANQIINHYRPSPPTFVDHADGMYGHYNNAYGRQDGNYHMW